MSRFADRYEVALQPCLGRDALAQLTDVALRIYVGKQYVKHTITEATTWERAQLDAEVAIATLQTIGAKVNGEPFDEPF